MNLLLSGFPAALLFSTAQTSPIAPRFVGVETYSETLEVTLDAGEVVVEVQLAISNLGFGDQNASCRALVLSPGGPWTATQYFSHADWRYTPGPPVAWHVGTCAFRAADHTVIDACFADASVHIDIAAPIHSLHPPDHHIDVGERFFDVQLLIPWAGASAELSLPAAAPHHVEGGAFVDHFRVTAFPDDLADLWVRLLVLGEPHGLLLQGRFAPDAEVASGWLYDEVLGAPVSLRAMHLMPDPGGGEQIRIVTAEQTYRVWHAAPLYRYAPLEELGLLGYVATALLGNPVTRTYRVTLDGGPGGERRRGLLEVTRRE